MFKDEERLPKEITIKPGVEALVREYWNLVYPMLEDHFDFDRALEQLIVFGLSGVKQLYPQPIQEQPSDLSHSALDNFLDE